MGDLFVDGSVQLGHAGKYSAAQTFYRDVAKQSRDHIHHEAEIGVKCI